ncbi:hypothetical protein [Kitasatospora sp. NPDC056531]|uniref:hypothetical protein n=1 Tax=Kitasatospora sp. NPDC056531 TaxID=3345856 RepID=UPI0036913D1E
MSRVSRAAARSLATLVAAGVGATLFTAAAPAQAASTAGGTITRSEVLARAQSWVNEGVPYNQQGYKTDANGTYREDCSGYVSMAWHLTDSLTTQTLPNVSTTISFSQLKAGDALDYTADHTFLFAGWTNQSTGDFTYYAESNKYDPTHGPTKANINSSSLEGWPTGNYTALRYNNIVDDAPPVTIRPSAVGVFRDGTWALRSGSGATTSAGFGQPGDVPITGDWDGVGHDQLGVFRPSTTTFALRHDDGSSDSLVFGNPGDIPVPGMWDHNGHAQMAVYRPSTNAFIVRHDNGSTDSVVFGNPGDIPIVGDWDGVGHTQMGVFRPAANGSQNTFALRHDDGTVSTAIYGNQGDLPIVGDWAGKGRTTFGVYRPSTATFALNNAYAGTPDSVITYGNPGDTPVTGNWS